MASLVVSIPVHNESQYLERAVRASLDSAAKLEHDFIIAIAEDGSTDGTYEIAKRLAESDSRVHVFHSESRLGRGEALRNGWSKLQGEIYVFFDADLATDLGFLTILIDQIKRGYDVVTGSRYLPGASVRRPVLRLFVSRIYNLIVSTIFATGISDHQCGFKAFSKRAVDELLPLTTSKDWFWDTEILALARRKGFRISEIPVKWKENRTNKTSLVRLLKDIRVHSLGMVQLCWKLLRS